MNNSGGWIDQPAARQKDINATDLINLRFKSLWKPTDDTSLEATVVVHRKDGGFSQSEDENGDFTQTFGLVTTPTVSDDYELYNLTGVSDFGFAEGMFSSSYRRSIRTFESDGRLFQILPPPLPAFDTLSDSRSRETVMSHEARLASTGDGALSWVIGGFYSDVESEGVTSTFFAFQPVPGDPLPAPILVATDNRSESWAVFGDVGLALFEGFEIGGGLRYFEDDREEVIGAQSASFDSLSPRVYANYDLSDSVTVYASVAKGFRSGGFNAPGQPVFDPDELWTYEIGTKFAFPAQGFDGEISAYFADYTDFQILGVDPAIPGATGIFSNGGDAEIKGIDARLGFQATDSLRFDASGSYVESEVTALRVISSPFVIGDPLDNVPEYSFSVSSSYDFTLIGKPASARLDYSQRGETRWTSRDVGAHFIGRSGVNNMLNLNVGIELTEQTSLSLTGENLLDDRDLIAPTELTGFAARNRPRTLGIEFSFRQ